MWYHLKANFLLYKSHSSPNPARSTLSPRRVTFPDVIMLKVTIILSPYPQSQRDYCNEHNNIRKIDNTCL